MYCFYNSIEIFGKTSQSRWHGQLIKDNGAI